MNVGDKYLSVSLKTADVFAECLAAVVKKEKYINLAAFKNEKKEKPEHPEYTGQMISIWVKEKKGNAEEESVL